MIDWIRFAILLIVASILHVYFSNKNNEGFLSCIKEPINDFIISPKNSGNQLENRFYYNFNSDNLNLSNFFEITNHKAVFYPNSKKNKKNYYTVSRNTF